MYDVMSESLRMQLLQPVFKLTRNGLGIAIHYLALITKNTKKECLLQLRHS